MVMLLFWMIRMDKYDQPVIFQLGGGRGTPGGGA